MLPPIPYNGAMAADADGRRHGGAVFAVATNAQEALLWRLLWAASAIYLLFLLYATLLSRTAGEEYSYRIEPLVTFRRAFAVEGGLAVADPQMLEGIAVNLLLMAPWAICCRSCLSSPPSRRCFWGAGLSLSVELIQLVTRLGMFELDDIIFNTLSVVLGHALLACAERRAGRRLRG